jgi:hypothetical protein
VPLARIDQQHLAGTDLSRLRAIVELQPPLRHDERNWNRVAVLRHFLARLEPQTNDAHRPAVRDLLKAEGTTRFIWR